MKKIAMVSLLIFLSSCANTSRFQVIYRDPSNFQTCFELMSNFLSPNERISSFKRPTIENAKSLDELEEAYGFESLIEIQKRIPNNEIKKQNEFLFTLLKQDLKTPSSTEYTRYVTDEEANFLLHKISNSKVNQNHICYDPDLSTGFCFGRATIGHMEALIRGVHPKSIKKIWIAGDMQQWGHHVANMIKTEKGWLVIDTNLERPVSPEEWLKTYLPMKAIGAKDIKVFVTRAERFGPYDIGEYSAVNLFNSTSHSFNRENDFYRGYFYDYFQDLEKEMPEIKKFPAR